MAFGIHVGRPVGLRRRLGGKAMREVGWRRDSSNVPVEAWLDTLDALARKRAGQRVACEADARRRLLLRGVLER